MVTGRNEATTPRAYCPTWPEGPCEDVDAEAVRLLAENLARHVGRGRTFTIRGAATAAGIDHTLVLRLLSGKAWPDARTVLRLERGLGVVLWPAHLGDRPRE